MNTTEKIIKELKIQLESMKHLNQYYTDEERFQQDGKELGVELAIEIAEKFLKPKTPKKLGKRAIEIQEFQEAMKEENIVRVVFPEENAFTYQYRINGTDASCMFFTKDNIECEDSDLECLVGQLLYKQIRDGYQGGCVEATDIMKLFKGTNIELLVIDSKDNSDDLVPNPRRMTNQDQFEVEGGSDS